LLIRKLFVCQNASYLAYVLATQTGRLARIDEMTRVTDHSSRPAVIVEEVINIGHLSANRCLLCCLSLSNVPKHNNSQVNWHKWRWLVINWLILSRWLKLARNRKEVSTLALWIEIHATARFQFCWMIIQSDLDSRLGYLVSVHP